MAGVIGAEAAGSVRERLLALEADTAFLVSDAGVDLVPSPTRELPPDPSDDFVPEPAGSGWSLTTRAPHQPVGRLERRRALNRPLSRDPGARSRRPRVHCRRYDTP